MKKNKYGFVSIIVAVILMIGQRAIMSGVTMPMYSANNTRYLIYQLLLSVTILGNSLIPIYLGYYSNQFKEKNPLKNLSKYFLYYLVAIIIIDIYFFVTTGKLTLDNIWGIFFPISRNAFNYASMLMITIIMLPYIIKFLDKQNSAYLKRLALITTILFVVMPTIFSKDIWMNNQINNPLWLLYLVILGYLFQRFNIVERLKYKTLHLIISLVLYFGSTLLMVSLSQILHNDLSTATRFIKVDSIFAVYVTLSIFVILQRILPKIKVTAQLIAALLISVQVTINWGLIVFNIETYYKKSGIQSGARWLFTIVLLGIVLLVTSLFITLISLLISKTKIFKKIDNKLSFSGLSEFEVKISKIFQWFKNNKRIFYTMIFFYIFTILQMFSISPAEIRVSVSKVVPSYLYLFFNRQNAIILNTLIITAFVFLIYLITKKFWYAFTFTFLIDLLLMISGYLKISLRHEPVLPADLKMLVGIQDILQMISPIIVIVGLILVVVFAIIGGVLQRRLAHKYSLKLNNKHRIVWIVILLFGFSGIFFVNHNGSLPSTIFDMFKINRYFYNQELGAQVNGPVVQFLNNVDTKVMNKPKNYSKEHIQAIMKRYDKEAIKINQARKPWAKDQTFIFNLSESFSDPARVPNQTISKDPIPYIKSVKKQNTSGLMMTPGYGGGTANIEWETLTGLDLSSLSATLPTPYTQLVEKQNIAPNITNLFDIKTAVHPYVATLYNRKNVYKKFGIQKFYFDGSKYKLKYMDPIDNSPYVSDESAYKDTLRVISKSKNKSQFIQLATMQNHMPFEAYYKNIDFKVSGSAAPDVYKPRVEDYMQGIHYTDKAVEDFLTELDKIDKPITLVWYGDHLPSLYSGDSMDKYGIQLHQTDYFLYNNKYTREHKKQSKVEVVSPNSFSAMALKEANIKVSPYYALITRVTKELPAMTTDPTNNGSNAYNGAQVFVTKDNEKITSNKLTKKQRKLLADYKLIQYDLTAGEQYAAKWATQKVK